MPTGRLRIDILGTAFSISADEDQVYLDALMKRYSTFVEAARRSTGLEDPLKLSIVAGIMLSDDAEKARRGLPRGTDDAERLTLDLIARIDEALGPK